VDADVFAARHPRLFHAAEAGAWPSIRRLGLLSTSALLDRFEVTGEQRAAIESARRPRAVELRHPLHGRAVIRDNRPLVPAALRACLVGMSPRAWYETLNAKVFFWTSQERLERLLSARAHRDRDHDVLVVDTARLLAAHEVRVTTINSGAALFASAPARGAFTFKRLAELPDDAAAVEVAVDHAVAHVEELVCDVWRPLRRPPPRGGRTRRPARGPADAPQRGPRPGPR
jgi:hypothetical protein